MPIYFELLVMMVLTYALGIGIGWAIWGKAPTEQADDKGETET